MLYTLHIDTPKNTAATSPVTTTVRIIRSVIRNWVISFPSGCMGLMRLRIVKDGKPLFPMNFDQYLSGDDHTFSIPEFIFIESEPYDLTVQSWNLDDTNNHAVQVCINVIPLWVYSVDSSQFQELFDREELRLI